MKCPRCKKTVKEVYIRQKFITSSVGTMNNKNEKRFDDLEAGYTDLGDWLLNMLNDEGEPQIIGCEKCF